MSPIDKFFQAIIEEANNLNDSISFVWYEGFYFDDCQWKVNQYLHRHTKCIWVGHGYYCIPNLANKPVFVYVDLNGVYIYSVNAMKDVLKVEQDYVNCMKENIDLCENQTNE